MRNRKTSTSDKTRGRVVTWGDLIEAAEEQVRRNTLKTQQLEALVLHMRSRQQAGEPLPLEVVE